MNFRSSLHGQAPAGSKPWAGRIRKAYPRSIEPFLFLIAVLLNALPVLLFKYFPSKDGAAHLYNARLIQELLFGQDTTVSLFYSFTAIPVPNWLGHFIQAAALTVLPAFLAEKLLLVIYIVGLPYAFRQLIKVISPRNVEYSFFILPFCYSYVFTLGFYNFSLALVLMLLTMAYWLKMASAPRTVRSSINLFVLLTLLYFAHIFIFGLTLCMIGLHTVINAIPRKPWGHAWFNDMFRSLWPKLWRLGIAAALPLLLALIYFWSMPAAPNATFVSKHELMEWLYTLRPIISYNTELERVYTQQIFYALVILAAMSLLVFPAMARLQHSGRDVMKAAMPNTRLALFWWALCLVVLVLYLLMPDERGLAGYMSIRLGLMLFIFIIAAVSLQKTPKWFTWVAVLFVLYCNYNLDYYYRSAVWYQNRIALNCERAASHIAPGSIVYPVNRSDNWLADHYSNYLGIDKPLVILKNYEAGLGYFPLQWNVAELPDLRLGRLRVADLIQEPWIQNEGRPKRDIDYVFVLGDINGFAIDADNDMVRETLEHFDLIYSNEDCAVYRFRGTPRAGSHERLEVEAQKYVAHD